MVLNTGSKCWMTGFPSFCFLPSPVLFELSFSRGSSITMVGRCSPVAAQSPQESGPESSSSQNCPSCFSLVLPHDPSLISGCVWERLIPPCDLSRDLRDQGVEEGPILQEEEFPEILPLHQGPCLSRLQGTAGRSKSSQMQELWEN